MFVKKILAAFALLLVALIAFPAFACDPDSYEAKLKVGFSGLRKCDIKLGEFAVVGETMKEAEARAEANSPEAIARVAAELARLEESGRLAGNSQLQADDASLFKQATAESWSMTKHKRRSDSHLLLKSVKVDGMILDISAMLDEYRWKECKTLPEKFHIWEANGELDKMAKAAIDSGNRLSYFRKHTSIPRQCLATVIRRNSNCGRIEDVVILSPAGDVVFTREEDPVKYWVNVPSTELFYYEAKLPSGFANQTVLRAAIEWVQAHPTVSAEGRVERKYECSVAS